jgi:hypothetical protein
MKTCSTTKPKRRKPAKIPDLFGYENLQSYQTYLERKTYRATRLIWRGKSAELPDLFGEHLQSYKTYLQRTTLRVSSPNRSGSSRFTIPNRSCRSACFSL